MYFSIFAIIFASTTALPYTAEPMVLSCTIGPSALECYKRFGTTCDADCNIINPAPMIIANGSCSDRTCACVDINALNGTDESGLAISTYSTTRSATKTNFRVGKATGTAKTDATVVTGSAPTGHCDHHYHHHHPNGTKPNTTTSTIHHHVLNCTHTVHTLRANATATATHHHVLNGTMTIHPFKINTTGTATHHLSRSSTILVTGAMFDETNTSSTTPY